jgi:hypothetical protein
MRSWRRSRIEGSGTAGRVWGAPTLSTSGGQVAQPAPSGERPSVSLTEMKEQLVSQRSTSRDVVVQIKVKLLGVT